MIAILLALVTAFTPMRDRRDRQTLLAGMWVSCVEEDGAYGERIWPYVVMGKTVWSLHLGPANEFALFGGDTDVHQEHNTEANLLWPAYHVGAYGALYGSKTWEAARAHVSITATRAGGGETCESFYVQVKQDRVVFAHR